MHTPCAMIRAWCITPPYRSRTHHTSCQQTSVLPTSTVLPTSACCTQAGAPHTPGEIPPHHHAPPLASHSIPPHRHPTPMRTPAAHTVTGTYMGPAPTAIYFATIRVCCTPTTRVHHSLTIRSHCIPPVRAVGGEKIHGVQYRTSLLHHHTCTSGR